MLLFLRKCDVDISLNAADLCEILNKQKECNNLYKMLHDRLIPNKIVMYH